MGPQENHIPSPPGDNQFRNRKRLLIFLAIAVAVLLVVLAFLGRHQPTPSATNTTNNAFRITTITPDIKHVTTQTTSLTIDFNKSLEAGSATIGSNPSIISGSTVTGNTLTLTFPAKKLLNSLTYTITINGIGSTSGDRLTNQVLTFTPKFVAPTITGEDALVNEGLSTDQANSLSTYIGQFDPWAQNVAIDESTIRHYQEDPTDAWTPWAFGFSMNVDGTNYNVVADFYDTEHVQVKISVPSTGQVLFTAGSPGSI